MLTVPRHLLPLIMWLALTAGLAAAGGPSPGRPMAEANRVVETSFTAQREHADPFNDLDLDVVFTTPKGETVRVPAFWAGGRAWRVRYSSPEVGIHRYRTVCTDAADAGLHNRHGEVEIRPYRGSNPLYRHGPVRVAADRRHFAHADGTPFFWLADTWWMGLCERLRWPEEFRTLAADRQGKGFNVIQIVAGLYPDMGAFDDRGRNEAGFPWERDYRSIRPAYFDRADERLQYLADHGFVPCIVGAWGYHLPWLGVERMKKHWRYLAARYGALPVVWCAAGEVNLPYYLEPGFPRGGEKQAAQWEEVIRYLRRVDGFHRPITVHPTGLPPLSGRALYADPGLLDFDMLQTGHGQQEVLPPTIEALRRSYASRPVMPVVNGEVAYEALINRIPAEIPRLMFWTNVLSGAAGHTYGANGIWQLNRRDQPYGNSPHGGNYGPIPWDEAMRLPGSAQLGLGKRFLETLPWHRFEPHPEWAGWAEASTPAWGSWVWYPEGDPAKDAPVAARCFRRAFELPAGRRIESAVLHLPVDDRVTAYLNGRRVGEGANWQAGAQFNVAHFLRPGRNILAVRGENAPGPPDANPAGLAASLEVRLAGGESVVVRSDGQWRCSRREEAGWEQPEFEDRGWERARTVARFGEGPWGRNVGRQNTYLGPYSAGVPGSLRIVYVPLPERVRITRLEPDAVYHAAYFDPVRGRRSAGRTARAAADGTWLVSPPAGTETDWLLVLQRNGVGKNR